MSTPLVKMLAHRGPVTDVAIDHSGRYMVTTGMDSQMKVWDIRTYRPVHQVDDFIPFQRNPITNLFLSSPYFSTTLRALPAVLTFRNGG